MLVEVNWKCSGSFFFVKFDLISGLFCFECHCGKFIELDRARDINTFNGSNCNWGRGVFY